MESESDDDSTEEEEIFYTVTWQHKEGSVSFDPEYLTFDPEDVEDSKVTSLRILWTDLQKCMLNTADSEKVLLKLVYRDKTNKPTTFELASRKDAKSLRDDIKSRLKSNSEPKTQSNSASGAQSQSQSQSQTSKKKIKKKKVVVRDIENQLPMVTAQALPVKSPNGVNKKSMEHPVAQRHRNNIQLAHFTPR